MGSAVFDRGDASRVESTAGNEDLSMDIFDDQTIVGYLRRRNTAQFQGIMSRGYSGDSNKYLWLLISNSAPYIGKLEWDHNDGSGSRKCHSSIVIPTESWTPFVATCTVAGSTLQVGGDTEDSQTDSLTNTNSTGPRLHIGTNANGSIQHWLDGDLFKAAWFDYAFTAQQRADFLAGTKLPEDYATAPVYFMDPTDKPSIETNQGTETITVDNIGDFVEYTADEPELPFTINIIEGGIALSGDDCTVAAVGGPSDVSIDITEGGVSLSGDAGTVDVIVPVPIDIAEGGLVLSADSGTVQGIAPVNLDIAEGGIMISGDSCVIAAFTTAEAPTVTILDDGGARWFEGWDACDSKREVLDKYRDVSFQGQAIFGSLTAVEDYIDFSTIRFPESSDWTIGFTLGMVGSTIEELPILRWESEAETLVTMSIRATPSVAGYHEYRVRLWTGDMVALIAEATFVFSSTSYWESRISFEDGVWELRGDGFQQVLATGLSLSALDPATKIRFYLQSADPASSVLVDNLYIYDNEALDLPRFFGPILVSSLFPVGAGSSDEWAPFPAKPNWSQVDEGTPDDDSTYVSSDTHSQSDSYEFTDSGVVGAIVGLQTNVTARVEAATGPRRMRAIVHVGGASYGSSISTQVSDTTYSNYPEVFEENPSTDSGWTGPQVDAAEFGMESTQ